MEYSSQETEDRNFCRNFSRNDTLDLVLHVLCAFFDIVFRLGEACLHSVFDFTTGLPL